MDKTVEEAAAWPERNNVGHVIFHPGHVTPAGILAESKDNLYPAAATLSGHHGISPRHRLCKGVQQEQASDHTQRGLHLGNASQRTKHFSWDLRPSRRKDFRWNVRNTIGRLTLHALSHSLVSATTLHRVLP